VIYRLQYYIIILYQEEVELPEKKYQSVVWMLDYLNPRIRFSMSGLLLFSNI